MAASVTPNVDTDIPYVNLAAQHAPLRQELLDAVGAVLDTGQFILGSQVREFEERLAAICGVPYAIGVNSGTDALVLALLAAGVGPGDEVITAPNSFVASAACARLVGARPVFADVRDDYNLDPACVAAAVTSRTKAIVAVHLTGRPCDMDALAAVAARHDLAIVEDCAQAVAAEYRGRRVGSFGFAGCFSLHPLKTLNACGDGGAITVHDRALHERFAIVRNLGLRTRDDCVVWAGNSRLDTLQAAMLLVKLRYFEDWTERRREHARRYRERLAGVSEVQAPSEQPHERAVYHTFVIQADRRDALREFLKARGIGTAVHYPVPIHLSTVGRELGYAKGSFPVTERLADRILSLPVYPELSADQIDRVSAGIRAFYGRTPDV